MDTDVKALIDRMRFQLQREGLKSAVRGALSDGADALTALSADNERLTKERDEAERLHNEKCGEHHQALVAESRAGSALGRASPYARGHEPPMWASVTATVVRLTVICAPGRAGWLVPPDRHLTLA